jgi:hypothetical protein
MTEEELPAKKLEDACAQLSEFFDSVVLLGRVEVEVDGEKRSRSYHSFHGGWHSNVGLMVEFIFHSAPKTSVDDD